MFSASLTPLLSDKTSTAERIFFECVLEILSVEFQVIGMWGEAVPPHAGFEASAVGVLRYMDLDTFAKEAKAAGAVVFMAVQGGLGQSGALQAFFEFHKVPFTGVPRSL